MSEAGLDKNAEKASCFFAPVLDAIPDAVLVFARTGVVIFANEAAKALFTKHGLPSPHSLEELQRTASMYKPGSLTAVPAGETPAGRALRGETAERGEYRVRLATPGKAWWIECGASPIPDSAGTVAGAVVSIRDITERKKRELAIGTEEQLRNFIYEGNLAGILQTTVDGRIVNCNDAIVRMLGYASREELRAMRAQQLYFDSAARDKLLSLIRVRGRLKEYEVCFRHRDHSPRWGLINVRFLDPGTDEVGGSLISIIIDITERKRWEETLRQSEERFTAFMRHLPGIAFIKDLSGRYVYYNDASSRLFNRDPREFLGKTDEALWPPDDAARYRANDAEVIALRQPREVIEPVLQTGGQHSWLIYKFPIIEGGKVTLVGGIGIDITERKALEEQLNQARKMEALGRLAGGVAHDFNNLLTVISGYGQLALEGMGQSATERVGAYLQEVLKSSRRAAGLTGQLLAFSRRQAMQPKVLDLGKLVQNLENLLQRTIGEHVELTVHYGSEPCVIQADSNQVEQVLMNLAMNARDAMPLGGTLDIRCTVLAEPRERPGKKPLGVMVEFRDTGIGMDAAVKAQLFEPFFTLKEKAKGTGLGLSTAYGIVTQADGEIEVESEPGEGSVFRIYFPLAEGEVERHAPAGKRSDLFGTETVLLVEDDSSVRLLAETMLQRLGYRVVAADGGRAALDVWDEWQGSIDILLTDVIMPQMGGGELAHRLRELKPGLKVLFMSGYTDDMLASHGVLAGETQLIQKPFTGEELARRLRDVLDASRQS